MTHNVVAALRGRGLTKAWAGGALTNSHKSSGGYTPPLSQNCSLGDVFPLFYAISLLL